MKDTNKQININGIHKELPKLLDEIDKSIEENGYDDTLEAIQQQMEGLIQDSEAFELLETAHYLTTPAIKRKILGLKGALYEMDDETLCDLYNRSSIILRVANFLKGEEDYSSKNQMICDANSLTYFSNNLKQNIAEEWFDRTQQYRYELEKAEETK